MMGYNLALCQYLAADNPAALAAVKQESDLDDRRNGFTSGPIVKVS